MDPVTFVFLLTTWSPDVPHAMVHVEDTNLSGGDCIALMESAYASDPNHDNGIPSCEIDAGGWEESNSVAYAVEIDGITQVYYPCPTEDSDNCIWDARWRGNGEGTGLGTGQSFVSVQGALYDVEFGEFDEIVSIEKRG